ncbi:rhamnan synthesis F family protein [Acidocella sp.]|uniref:rhamnan synthesis F family protein n=1 Tax=Acidocella sp. TaxID=50710 RepID=UPI003D015C26
MNRRLKGWLYAAGSRVKWWTVVPLAVAVGRVRGRRQVVHAWPSSLPGLGPRVVLFMHFDGRGAVRRQVLDYIQAFKESGRAVVFVTNSGGLRPEAMEALRGLCAAVLVRRNIGYDFGAWADALEHLGLPGPDTEEVIMANDSVFGPLLPLGNMLRRLDYAKADIWGLTESWQVRYHLQSFFLAFGPKALRAEGFRAFWAGVRPVPVKSYIVKTYEVGVTQAMVKAGLSCAALWSYEALTALADREELGRLLAEEENGPGKGDPVQETRKLQLLRIREGLAQRVALNPTSDLWRQLLLSGFPFIKRELLRDNPSGVRDVGDWAQVVREEMGADPEPIRQELRLMMKGKAP